MTKLLDVLDSKTFDKIYLYAKEHKKKIRPIPSYRDYILFEGRLEIMKIISKDIPMSISFEGNDLLGYMEHIGLCLDCTNGLDLYRRNYYRR